MSRLVVKWVALIVMVCVAAALVAWRIYTGRPIPTGFLVVSTGMLVVGAVLRLAWRPPS